MSKDGILNHNGSPVSDPSVIDSTSNLDRNIPHSNISPLNLVFLDLMIIPVFIYKILALLIPPTVPTPFNKSLSEDIFPECFKAAKIIPIFKFGDSNSSVNYRPISMLPFLSKIFEKLTCARPDSCLKYNNILYINQCGFGKNSNIR